MNIKSIRLHLNHLFSTSFFRDKKYIISLWLIITLISSIKQYLIGSFNNYKIFKGVYYHTIHLLPLYNEYPTEYFDHNHYGPLFSIIIAPFALLPDYLGLPLWGIVNSILLIWAITQLPLARTQINGILWICLNEFITSLLGLQINPMITAFIILAFINIEKQNDFWAAFFIVLGTFIKLYGIVGFAFFFFSKNKIKFILSIFFWSLILFLLPMAISSTNYILDTYIQWYERLVIKNNENVSLTSRQDICLMGIVRRIIHDSSIQNLPFLVTGVAFFGLQYLRIKEYKKQGFRLMLLASVLIFTVIFSTGSESPTYIIAFLGVAIWFVVQPKPVSRLYLFLFIFAMVVTSFSPSDLMPKYIRETYINPYALKALPCVLIWIIIISEMLTKKFDSYITSQN